MFDKKLLSLRHCACAAIVWLVCLGGIVSSAQGQTAQFTQNSTTTNTMTMQIPLANYPGRGASLPVSLHYSSTVWRVGFIKSVYAAPSLRRSVTEAIYSEHSVAGWTTSLDIPKVEWPRLNDLYFHDGKPYAGLPNTLNTYRVAQVFIHMPDGSTHELRKADQVYQNPDTIEMIGQFWAVDGSRMRYDSTGETTGILYLADGTRYILNGANARRPTNINGVFSVVNKVVYHYWLRTDQKEAGLGPLGGGVPGQNAPPDSPYVTQTAINDHKGESEQPGATCEEAREADPEVVNRMLEIGKPMGRFSPTNNCFTLVNRILWEARGGDKKMIGTPDWYGVP